MTKIKLTIGEYPGNIEKRLSYISSGSVFDVFPNTFMEDYTKHAGFTDFCTSINCDMTSQSDLDGLDNGIFDEAIRQQSQFDSWEDMAETAYYLQLKKN